MVCLLEILFSLRAELCELLDRSALGAFPCHTQKIGLEMPFCISTEWIQKSMGERESSAPYWEGHLFQTWSLEILHWKSILLFNSERPETKSLLQANQKSNLNLCLLPTEYNLLPRLIYAPMPTFTRNSSSPQPFFHFSLPNQNFSGFTKLGFGRKESWHTQFSVKHGGFGPAKHLHS